MDQTPPTAAPTDQPDPPKDQASPAAPACVAFLLHVVRALLGYGRRLDQALPAQAAHTRFPTLAAAFGTHDVRRILAHIQRGILKAMMLERYLLARAAAGRDVEPEEPAGPADASDIEALDLKLRAAPQPRAATRRETRADPDDPLHFAIPTMRELEAQVRRNPVGRTIAEICMDLGITASVCDAGTWDEIYQALVHFGANLERFFGVQQRRRETFRQEREKRPETWDWDWRDRPKEAIRQILGHLLGEPPPDAAPG